MSETKSVKVVIPGARTVGEVAKSLGYSRQSFINSLHNLGPNKDLPYFLVKREMWIWDSDFAEFMKGAVQRTQAQAALRRAKRAAKVGQ